MPNERNLKLYTIFISLVIITITFFITIQQLIYYFNN